ncbi:type II secretion system protein GspI [Sphingobium sp. SCG-1]|uniref:type II secretion system minor pseudopilin GspI n=1 Tax=Sphingobium sp. SCG-1 TaxID=2072936 RepID=UPI000CD6C0BC|nr:type II secretion system minor pseudopilin GspI [Sphingobium sp. SCG-1]AUW58697.1 type II secretion system protein GspI [Sphingobium sp. SCG-1]
MANRRGESGFTLLEMLVALAVFSLAALALIRLQGVTIRTAADLDSKVLAQMVARNLMVGWQTDTQPPSLGEANGEVENAGQRWRWTREATKLDDQRLMRVDVRVEGQNSPAPAVLTFVRAIE